MEPEARRWPLTPQLSSPCVSSPEGGELHRHDPWGISPSFTPLESSDSHAQNVSASVRVCERALVIHVILSLFHALGTTAIHRRQPQRGPLTGRRCVGRIQACPVIAARTPWAAAGRCVRGGVAHAMAGHQGSTALRFAVPRAARGSPFAVWCSLAVSRWRARPRRVALERLLPAGVDGSTARTGLARGLSDTVGSAAFSILWTPRRRIGGGAMSHACPRIAVDPRESGLVDTLCGTLRVRPMLTRGAGRNRPKYPDALSCWFRPMLDVVAH